MNIIKTGKYPKKGIIMQKMPEKIRGKDRKYVEHPGCQWYP
jgi:hypothetical protein